MAAVLPRSERKVLASLNRYGPVSVRRGDSAHATVRALAKRGLVDYQPATGVVRRTSKEG